MSSFADAFYGSACLASERSPDYPTGKPISLALIMDFWRPAYLDIRYGVITGWLDGDPVYCDVYTLKSVEAALVFDLSQVAKNKVIIKRCKNCGKFFIPNSRSDEVYCDNVYLNRKTYKELGYEAKIENDAMLNCQVKCATSCRKT